MSSFPATKYVRYKRATAFFLNWLLRAYSQGCHTAKRLELSALGGIVQIIAANPLTLSPKLLAELPRALVACQCPVTLRERVATFFADDERGHQHFLELLRSWLNALKGIEVKQQECAVETKFTQFENYYEVLELDEDYFPDEDTFVAESGTPTIAKVDRQRLLDEAFAEDMALEVMYFFKELEELSQEVFTKFDQVKNRECTLMEATVVTTLALDTVRGLTTMLQLRYPQLRSAGDLLEIVSNKASEAWVRRLEQSQRTAWDCFAESGAYNHGPMFLVNFVSIVKTLDTFTGMVPPDFRWQIALPADLHGEPYDEERTHTTCFLRKVNGDISAATVAGAV